MKPCDRSSERGYVLLAVLWLLLLAAAMVSAMLYGAMSQARSAAGEIEFAKNQLALDSIADTIIASRLIEGAASEWWQPVDGRETELDGLHVRVAIIPASTLTDLNVASAETIIEAAQTTDVSQDRARQLAQNVMSLRERGRVESVMQAAPDFPLREVGCLERVMTVVGGNAGLGPDAPTRNLGSIRIDIRSSVGARRIRLTPSGEVSRWDDFILGCGDAD